VSRAVVSAVVIIIILAGAVIGAVVFRDRDGVGRSSPTPSAGLATASGAAATAPASTTAAAATTAGSPTPSLSINDRFGFAVQNRDVAIRGETSDAVISSFAPKDRSFTFYSRVVSPDGRFVAYWDPVEGGPVLRVRSVLGGDARAVLTGPSGMSGNAFAWSSDSTGLVVAVDNNCFGVCGGTGGTLAAELWTVDVGSGATEKIATGSIWLPVAWDRAAKLVAAGVTGEGGYLTGYDVVDLNLQPHPVRSITFRPTVIGRLKASGDARYVMLSVGIQGSPSSLAWWPIAQPEKRAPVQFDGLTAEWRPGTSEIWWMDGREPAGCVMEMCAGTELISFNVATGARTVVQRGRFGSLLEGFRVDGSAAIISAHSTARTELTLIEIATGRMTNVRISGFLAGAVRLR
jgi:hypothetical protein